MAQKNGQNVTRLHFIWKFPRNNTFQIFFSQTCWFYFFFQPFLYNFWSSNPLGALCDQLLLFLVIYQYFCIIWSEIDQKYYKNTWKSFLNFWTHQLCPIFSVFLRFWRIYPLQNMKIKKKSKKKWQNFKNWRPSVAEVTFHSKLPKCHKITFH